MVAIMCPYEKELREQQLEMEVQQITSQLIEV
jgi:hypothetical protein